MIEKIKLSIEQKKEWNALNKRAMALDKDYEFVYKQMLKYIYKVANVSMEELFEIITEIIEQFEFASKQGTHVLDVSSRDVAGYCDAILENYNTEDIISKQVEEAIIESYRKSKNK